MSRFNSTPIPNGTDATTVFDYYEGYDFTSAYVGAVLNAVIIPVQLLVAKIIWSNCELWRNASYCLIFRLIMLEFVQSVATVISGIFPLTPQFWQMDFPRKVRKDQQILRFWRETKNAQPFTTVAKISYLFKSCAVALSAFFLMLFPLMSELSVFRILIILKRATPNKLPLPLMIFEAICFILMIALSIPIYLNESVHFYYGDWDFKHDIFVEILNTSELYFCYPMLILTYCSYLVLIGLIYGIRKGSRSAAKEEWILFGVSTFTTIYFVSVIGYFQLFGWYMGPEPPFLNFWFQVWIQFISGTNYYWTALILLMFNKTIRSKIVFRLVTDSEQQLSTTSNASQSRRRF